MIGSVQGAFTSAKSAIGKVAPSTKTVAAHNDWDGRVRALWGAAQHLGSESFALIFDKDPNAFQFFVERWLYAENLSIRKSKVYQNVIKRLVEALNRAVQSSGLTYDENLLEEQNKEYRDIKVAEDANKRIEYTRLSSATGAFVLNAVSKLVNGTPRIDDPEENYIRPREQVRQHKEMDSETILKYPFQRKLKFLKRCSPSSLTGAALAALAADPPFANTCLETVQEKHPDETFDREYFVQKVAQIEAEPNQLTKNRLIDDAIVEAFKRIQPLAPSYVSSALTTVNAATKAASAFGSAASAATRKALLPPSSFSRSDDTVKLTTPISDLLFGSKKGGVKRRKTRRRRKRR